VPDVAIAAPTALARARLRLAVQLGAMAAAYYVVPVEPLSTASLAVRAAAAVLLVGLVVWLVGREVLREVRVPAEQARLARLVLVIVAGVLLFALADFLVATLDPGQFVGLATRTDALYFALTTLTTIGFGDVHAAGQFARGLVIVQMLFNIIVLAAAVRALVQGVATRRG
jgi:voltage-gated potassium channel